MRPPAALKEPPRILIVDDDDVFRAAIAGTLQQAGYQVLLARDGRSAKALIGIEKLDAVLTDIRMPDVNGIELLHFVKRTKPMPVILMTGFAELTETKEAHDLGADEFIAKPFKREELLEAVQACCSNLTNKEGRQLGDDEFCKLSIDDFTTGKEILFDIYIRLSDAKYVKIAHQGEDLPIERVTSYKSKNIRFLYMKKDDFRKYIGFNLTLVKALQASQIVSKAKKLRFMKHTAEVMLEQLYFNAVNREAFDNATTVVETTVSLLIDNKDLYDLLSVLNTHTDFLYAHSVGVSLYSTMIAREIGWKSSTTAFKIAVGGLMHDIGKKEIAAETLKKPRKDLTPEEVKLIESHPMRGFDLLGFQPDVTSDILQIVLQHHELSSGQGYPQGLTHNRIHPLARLVSLANEFCNLALKNPQSPGIPPQDAISRLCLIREGAFDPASMAALCKIFGMEVPVNAAKSKLRKI